MKFPTAEEYIAHCQRRRYMVVDRLLKETVSEVEHNVALLSNGNVVVCVECPSCGQRFVDVRDRDWHVALCRCPVCGESSCGCPNNPFYEEYPTQLPCGLSWTGDIPKVGMSFEGILKRERQ